MIMKKEEYDAIPTLTKLKENHPLLYHRLITQKGSICLNCQYEPHELEELYEGYGCPKCHSPFVVTITDIPSKNGKEVS